MHLLLVSRQPEDTDFAKEAAAEANSDCTRLFLVDVSTPELIEGFLSAFSEKIGKAPGKLNPRYIHLIGTEVSQTSSTLIQQDCFGHFVVRKYNNAAEAGKLYGRVARRLCVEGDTTLQKFLGVGAQVKVTRILHSTVKSQVLEQAKLMLTEEVGYAELKLLKHLFSAGPGNDYQVDNQIANAGIGLSTSFRNGGSLIFVCQTGAKTEVTLFFRISRSFKEFKTQFRFISVLVD